MDNVQLYLGTFTIMVLLGMITMDRTTHINVYNNFLISNNDDETYAPSKLACVNKCLRIEECIAITYMTYTKACIIIHRGILTVEGGSNDDKVIIVKSAPGLFIQKSTYDYSKDDAASVCASLGGRLMTLPELQTLFEDGYSKCSCGWLTGGIRRYIMQTAHTGCGNKIGIVNCDWANKAHAWCMPN